MLDRRQEHNMAYKINKSDGTLLVDLVDGKIDSDTIDLTLIGRNTTGYGEVMNENFVKILENFAGSSEPEQPLRGQVWYDTGDGRLKVFDGTIFRSTDTTVVAKAQPNLLSGDIWIDSGNKQVYFSDGNDVILAGPIYNVAQKKTGTEPITIVDKFGQKKTVIRYMIGGSAVLLISKEDFVAANTTENINLLTGFSTTIKAGITINSTYTEDFEFYGNAKSTSNLTDANGTEYDPSDFVFKVTNDEQKITSPLHFSDPQGIFIGPDKDIQLVFNQNDDKAILNVRNRNDDFVLQVNDNGTIVEPLFVDTSERYIGLWNNAPDTAVHIGSSSNRKDLKVSGNLIVEGDTTTLETQNLRVEDKLIELAVTEDSSSQLTLAQMDDSGIIIRGGPLGYTDQEKAWTWRNTTNAWTSTTHIDVPEDYVYKIGGTEVLSTDTLANSVTSATGLTQIGTLINLDVDNFNFNSSTMTVTTGLTLTTGGDITITNGNKILNVGTPDVSDDPNTAATKEYVDNLNLDADEHLSLDITGLSNPQIADVIEDLIPAITKNTGVYCRVHCVSYTGTYTYNAGDGLSKTFTSVDKNGVENQSVLEDIGFSEQADQAVTLNVTRSLKRFIINGSQEWEFESDLVSSV